MISGKDAGDPYIGRFKTCWWEENGKPKDAVVEIKINAAGTYDLVWTYKGGVIWNGLGIIEDKNLVGCYWPEP